MDKIRNPFSPGAGSPPPELAGREGILEQARVLFGRVQARRPEKSLLLTGLRGVGKTVLLNQIERIALAEGFRTILVEAHERKPLAVLLAPHLRRLLFDLDRVKADLARSTLQTHQVLRDSADRLIYRSRFPDEDLVFHHFHRVLVVGGRSFVVQDGPQGRFTEADVLRMEAAVRPKQAS